MMVKIFIIVFISLILALSAADDEIMVFVSETSSGVLVHLNNYLHVPNVRCLILEGTDELPVYTSQSCQIRLKSQSKLNYEDKSSFRFIVQLLSGNSRTRKLFL